jgi:hypothetical protein
MGGSGALAEHLNVPHAAILRWLKGLAEPPPQIWLKAVDITHAGDVRK